MGSEERIERGGGGGAVNSCKAHRARLARGVEVAAGKLEIAEPAAGFANRYDFGVRGGIVRSCDAVGAFGHHAAVLHDQGGERAAPAGANVLESQGNGAAHKICGHGFVSLFQGALPVANYKCSFFRMRRFEKSCPCPPQAACVANAATATSIKLTNTPPTPILTAH